MHLPSSSFQDTVDGKFNTNLDGRNPKKNGIKHLVAGA